MHLFCQVSFSSGEIKRQKRYEMPFDDPLEELRRFHDEHELTEEEVGQLKNLDQGLDLYLKVTT